MAAAVVVKDVAGDDTAIEEVANFFVDAFWGSGASPLKDGQRRQLVSEQRRDLRQRYGAMDTPREVSATLPLSLQWCDSMPA